MSGELAPLLGACCTQYIGDAMTSPPRFSRQVRENTILAEFKHMMAGKFGEGSAK